MVRFAINRIAQAIPTPSIPRRPARCSTQRAIHCSLEFTSPFYAIAKSVAAQWKEVGVETKLVRLDSQIWTDKVYRKNDFDVSLDFAHRAFQPDLGRRSELPLQRGPCALYEPKRLLQSGARPHRARGGLGAVGSGALSTSNMPRPSRATSTSLTLTNAPTYNAVATKFQKLDALFNVSFNEHSSWADAWLPENAR
jgi:peptide/nickel transport system substrate-binding protein